MSAFGVRGEGDGPRELIAALESRYPWQQAVIHGAHWRWMETDGDGARVALLPGALGDGAMFASTLDSLGGRLRLIAVSYPDSDNPASLAAGFAELVRMRQWGGLAVVGSSYGAYWAQFLARDHGENLGALLLGNTFTEATDVLEDPVAEHERLRRATDAEVHAQWLARVRATPEGPMRDLQTLMLSERQSPASIRTRMLGVAQARAAGPVALPGRRVFTVACANDPLIPEHGRATVEQAWPQARHVRLTTGGHYPHLLAKPDYERLLLELVA